jgi:flagellar basal-body rod protein FlgB
MANFLIGAIDFQAKALELQAERGRVLASNIANADTPNYKARDFDFQQALAAATGANGAGGAAAGGGSLAPVRTNAAHLPGPAGDAGSPPLLYRAPLQSAVDGNTVDLDVERANFAQNSVRYEATLRFLNGQIKQMMTAINGQ